MNISPRKLVCSKATKLERVGVLGGEGTGHGDSGINTEEGRRRTAEKSNTHEEEKYREVGGAQITSLCGNLRAALHNDTTHSIHATVTHVHTLILDLHHPALEVLLVEQHDLHRGDDGSVGWITGNSV